MAHLRRQRSRNSRADYLFPFRIVVNWHVGMDCGHLGYNPKCRYLPIIGIFKGTVCPKFLLEHCTRWKAGRYGCLALPGKLATVATLNSREAVSPIKCPVRLRLGSTKERLIASVWEAVECLRQQWPIKSSSRNRAALQSTIIVPLDRRQLPWGRLGAAS